MAEYKIEVKPWMLKPSTADFTFMQDVNNNVPMPLLIMYGVKIGETARMVKMRLHGDLKDRITRRCMRCGIEITNPVSQFFGMGPVCGGHNYTNPFSSEDELNKAVASYRERLVNTVWVGYIPKSAIVAINDNPDVLNMLALMPLVPDTTPGPPTVDTSNIAFTIHARIDKPIKGTDDFSVFLTFKYNNSVKDAIKELRTHIWHDDQKMWEIEYREFDDLKKKLPACHWDITNEGILPAKVDIDSAYTFKTKPMTHQIEGVLYGLEHSRWLLADEQGCGKTKQIIDLGLIRKQTEGVRHCLIICGVNSLKWNWLEEIEKHSNETGWILGMHLTPRSKRWVIGSVRDRLMDLDKIGNDPEFDSHYFLITNIETIRNNDVAAKLGSLCEQGVLAMVAVDEVHRCRNLRTQQGANLLQLQPKYRIGMTGTPLINSPLDLYAILKWLGYQRYSFRSFRDHFCYVDEYGSVVGYKNIDQLSATLDSIMLRRTKDQVLDLPPKVYMNEYVDLTDEQRSLYNQIIDGAIEDPEYSGLVNDECVLTMYLRLRQVSGGIGPFAGISKNPKLDRLEQLIEEADYAGRKVIVYSNWTSAIYPALARFKKYNPVYITGDVESSVRQETVNRFQSDSSAKVIFGTIDAMGTGITLTAANEVIFLDEPWTNAVKEQACDRAHRFGTESTVFVRTIMAYGTYDESVHDVVLGKKKMSDTIVDKKDLKQLKV